MTKRNLHILHADDDADDRWIFEDCVKQYGAITLTQFEDGEPLLDYVRGLEADDAKCVAIICDMQMRRMGGVEVLSLMKKLPGWEQTPVIIFSTSSFSADIRTCLDKGAFGFYSKPNTIAGALCIIKEMLDTVAMR